MRECNSSQWQREVAEKERTHPVFCSLSAAQISPTAALRCFCFAPLFDVQVNQMCKQAVLHNQTCQGWNTFLGKKRKEKHHTVQPCLV